jgi:hypothetical protein
MRLIDEVLNDAPARLEVGRPGEQALGELRLANPRYVLDRLASKACGDLIRNADELFRYADPVMRVPGELFWLEAFQEADLMRRDKCGRVGVLVHAGPNGRSGYVHHFTGLPSGGWNRLPAWTEFDFDRPLSPRNDHCFRLSHGELSHIDEFLKHTMLHAEPDGLEILQGLDRSHYLRRLGEAAWFDVPLMAAFAALMASPGMIDAVPSDLVRLNRARSRNRKPPLLDHLEVRLVLGAPRHGARGAIFERRTPPRLHFVRGHFVHRRGKSFWRSSHLRGDSSRALVQRTVKVTAAGVLRR